MKKQRKRSLAPGAVGFHGDRYLLELVDHLMPEVKAFVETGANVGTTLGYVARRWPGLPCFSCEPDAEACAAARAHGVVRPGVELFQEPSQAFLPRLERDHPELFDEPVLAWLDAHDRGFEWPLRQEVAFATRAFRRGWLLIDDFEVPGRPAFRFSSLQAQTCNFEFIREAVAPDVAYRLYYPAYEAHTSPHPPLIGWGLLEFGFDVEERPPDALPRALPHVLELDLASSRLSAAEALLAEGERHFVRGNLPRAELLFQRAVRLDPASAQAWNDLAVCRAARGDLSGAEDAWVTALEREPEHEAARANLAELRGAAGG